jgi:hypothetical protein
VTDARSAQVKKYEASLNHTEYIQNIFFGSIDILSQLNESYHVSIQYHIELEDQK